MNTINIIDASELARRWQGPVPWIRNWTREGPPMIRSPTSNFGDTCDLNAALPYSRNGSKSADAERSIAAMANFAAGVGVGFAPIMPIFATPSLAASQMSGGQVAGSLAP